MAYEDNHITKFETIFLSEEVPDDGRIPLLKHFCNQYGELGLAPAYPGGSHGNLSFRINSGTPEMIITASKTALSDDLRDIDFARVSNVDLASGSVYAHGKRLPSSESMIHYAIYEQRPDIHAIFHGHSAEVLRDAKRLLIPETEEEKPFGTVELVNQVLKALDNHDFIVMINHGFICMGTSLDHAWVNTVKVYNKIESASLK